MSIKSQILFFKNELPPKVKLVAVSKFKPVKDIMEAYEAGQRCFGENRPQELATKAPLLPKDIEWHFIGHLQSNKIKFVLPYASLIHSVDSEKLLSEINKHAAAANIIVSCLIELHVAKEDTKFGFGFDEALSLASTRLYDYPNVRIKGLMAMATHTDDEEEVKSEFSSITAFLPEFASTAATSAPAFYKKEDISIISMGMTHDYELAVAAGSNLVRIGSAIFGSRV